LDYGIDVVLLCADHRSVEEISVPGSEGIGFVDDPVFLGKREHNSSAYLVG
jgi:hypothetical protein